MTGSNPSEEAARRTAEQAKGVIENDLASGRPAGRVGKFETDPVSEVIPPRSALSTLGTQSGRLAAGCLVAVLGLAAAAFILPNLLRDDGANPSSPTPAATPDQTRVETPTPTSTSTSTTLRDYAVSLSPPDAGAVILDKGGDLTYAYSVLSSMTVAQLDSYYMQQLPADGWSINGTRRFDSRVIFEVSMATAGVGGLVGLQPADGGTTVEIQVGMSPPDGGGGGGRLTSPDDTGDVVTDAGQPIDDPEVDIIETSFQKIADDRYRVTVTLVTGLVHGYSFALLVQIDGETAVLLILYEGHDGQLRMGQLDPRTGQVIAGESEGITVAYDPATATGTFEFPGALLPDGTARYTVQSFHLPTEGDPDGRRTDTSATVNIGFLICGGTCQ